MKSCQFVPPSTPALLIDGKCRIWVRFKCMGNGNAVFEQFGRTETLTLPVKTYGVAWSLETIT